MERGHFRAIMATAGATQGDEGWWQLPDGKFLTLHVAHNGVGLSVARGVGMREEGTLVFVRTVKGETFVLDQSDIFAGAIEGTATSSARTAGFSPR
ncbi:MAG: hypothetical protein MUF34_02370 [Polyangiaceae bacterium]|jgi:hypothetical protein|nr:hypothetical protein [Polyangiaceae bacterium]